MDLTKNTVWVLFNTPYYIANVQSGPISIFFWKFVDLNSGVLPNLNISNYDRICDGVCPHVMFEWIKTTERARAI